MTLDGVVRDVPDTTANDEAFAVAATTRPPVPSPRFALVAVINTAPTPSSTPAEPCGRQRTNFHRTADHPAHGRVKFQLWPMYGLNGSAQRM